MRKLLVALIICTWAGVALPRDGATQEPQVHDAAMSALNLAKHHYKNGSFAKAAGLFQEAFDIDANPLFLYNAGRAWQRAFKLSRAKATFTTFLDLEAKGAFEGPDHTAAVRRATMHLQEIKITEKHLQQAHLRGARAAAPGAGTPKGPLPTKGQAPAPSHGDGAATIGADDDSGTGPTVARPGGSWRAPAGWGTGGLGLALLAYGGWLLADIGSRSADLDAQANATKTPDGKVAGMDAQTYQAERDAILSDQPVAIAVMSAGVVAVGLGAYLLWTDAAAGAVTLAPRLDGRGLTLAGRF